jgi:hypothetical protein
MKAGHPPRLPLALLERCVPDNDPLVGDLLEGWLERSDAWFWRQVVLAVLSRTALQVRTNPFSTGLFIGIDSGSLCEPQPSS